MADEAGKSSAGATTSTEPPSRDFDVYLSFRGPDTRDIAHALYNALLHAGVRVLYDSDVLRTGENIGEVLKGAMANSTIYIPIFSRGYVSSRRCLRELAEIMKYLLRNDKMILPIFYDVDPSDVRLETELYTTAFQEHEKVVGEDEVQRWKMALREVAPKNEFNIRNRG